MTQSEFVAFKVLGDLLQYHQKLLERPNISIYFRSYLGKKLIFAKPDEDYQLSETTFDPFECHQARICSLNMHESELADRTIISDSYKKEGDSADMFTVVSPVYDQGEIIGDVVVDIRINYEYLSGRSVKTELIDGFYYVTIGYENYPLFEFVGGFILPVDNDTVIIYQLPIVKVFIDNLWLLLVTWLIVMVLYELYASNVKHKSQLAYAIKSAGLDELTSLYNRKVFEDKDFESAIKEGNYSVILIDGKKFKQINDTYGHKAGDLALIHIANAMKSTFRQSDWLVRLGGDEFVVVMPQCPLEPAERQATNLRKNVTAYPLAQYGIEVHVTTGVASATNEEKFTNVLERADQNMYKHKDI